MTWVKFPINQKLWFLIFSGDVPLWDGETGELIDNEVADNEVAKDLYNIKSLKFNQDGTKVIIEVVKRDKSYTSHSTLLYTATANYSADALTAIKKTLATEGKSIKFKTESPLTAKFGFAGKIAILDISGDVSIWDGDTGKLFNNTDAKNQYNVKSLEFNQDGTKVIIARLSMVGYENILLMCCVLLKMLNCRR